MKSSVSKIGKGVLLSILVLAIIISIPYVINHLVLGRNLPFNSSIAGTDDVERTWLVFWSNYLGCVISSIITFVVLFLTLKQNNEQNRKNREDAHNENSMLRDYQDKQFQYERAMKHVSEIRKAAVSMYHSQVNSNTDEIYTIISLDNPKDIDFKTVRTLLLSISNEVHRSYVEMQMLLSYDGIRDEKTDAQMELIQKMSDESFNYIRDLVHFYIMCMQSNIISDEALKAEIYKNSADNKERLKLPDHKNIWDIIIDENLMDIRKNRFIIVSKWNDEWIKIRDLYLISLRVLVNHYYMEAQSLIA